MTAPQPVDERPPAIEARPADPAGPRRRPGPVDPGPRWPWNRSTLAVAGLAVAWAGYAIAHAQLSGRWWGTLVPDLAPPLVFLLMPVGVLVAAWMGVARQHTWRHPVACLAGCLALWSAIVGWSSNGLRVPALFDRGTPVAAGDLRVLSWNTAWWGQDVQPDRFWAALRAQRADVYLLQEYLHGVDWREENLSPVDDLARVREEFPGYTIVTRGELITLSRYPVTGQELVGAGELLANEPEASWMEVYRAVKVLRVDIDVHGDPLSLYNVHVPVQIDPGWHLLSRDVVDMLRQRQVSRDAVFDGLEAELRDRIRQRTPLLVAGDFNSSPAMGEMTWLRENLNDASDSGSDLYPWSWNELVPAFGLWQLDWAFTTDQADVDHYRLDDMDGLSDHRAQVMEVSLDRDEGDRR